MGRIRAKPPLGTPHAPLLLILLLFSAITLYHSLVLPLGEADDETDHYQYLRFVARSGHPPFSQTERNEAGFKGGLAPLYYWLTAWPIALVGEDTLPDIRRVDARPERHIPSDGLGINHVLHTLDEQWPWHGQVLAWHLVRFLSLPLAWVTLIATYALGRRLWPQSRLIALGAAAFIALLPRFVSSSAVINDDNLVFALTSLLLLTQVIILQKTSPSFPQTGGHRMGLFAIFGALFGLALITKYFALILIPEVIFTLLIAHRAGQSPAGPTISEAPLSSLSHPKSQIPNPKSQIPRFRSLLLFLLALSLTAGPWFAFITVRFNRIAALGLIPGLAASLGEPQVTEGLVGLLSGQSIRPIAATYALPEWLGLLYRSFWFEYGWMQLFAPNWIYTLFTIFLLLALLGYGLHLAPHLSRIRYHLSPITYLLGLHLLLFVLVVLARYVLSATIDTGQGRHLYPALPVIALLISLGLSQLGVRLLDVGFRTFPALAAELLPALLRFLPASRQLLPATFYLLPAIFYLLPAAFSLQPSAFILPHFHTLPVTITPPAHLPITYRHNLPFADGLAMAGFDAAPAVAAGESLPVTLYWQAGREAQQDYLVSLCLQDSGNQPVACWRGHFVDGRYPARAWEAGDTIRDTVFIPIPTCYHISDQTYRLRLEVWPLALDSPEPALAGSPVLQQTFNEPLISIQAAGSLQENLPQTVDLWHAGRRLTEPASLSLGESLAWLDYNLVKPHQSPRFVTPATGTITPWLPLAELNTSLFLPCDDGPTPFVQLAHFIAGPALPSGPYFPENIPNPASRSLSLKLRYRTLAPISSTLVFSPHLAPLSLEFPGRPPLSLMEEENAAPENPKDAHFPTVQPAASILPITIRWQARRWMAEPLIVSLKLLDKDFQVAGERLATLGDRYPNVLWVPSEIVEETYPLRLNPKAPPGLYRLEVSLLRQDKALPHGYEYLPLSRGETILGNNLYPATFRLPDPAEGTPPPQPFSAQLGDAIQLTGYDLKPSAHLSHPPFDISLALYWQPTAKISTDYTVFTQLLNPAGQVAAQWDNPPQAGRYPTTAWAERDTVVDRYTLTLAQDAPPGPYRLLVGMYNPTTGQRLAVKINGQAQPDNAIELTLLTIAP